MEFLLVIGVGTVIAVWVVASLPRSRRGQPSSTPRIDLGTRDTPPWKKDITETYSLGELDYLDKLDRYQRDPQHWPCPIPPKREGQ